MKITKRPYEEYYFANKEVNLNGSIRKCPFCGESGAAETTIDGHHGTFHRKMHIKLYDFAPWDEPIIKQVDHYECWDCGAEWESEPYELGEYR